jgi:hypothetical protein
MSHLGSSRGWLGEQPLRHRAGVRALTWSTTGRPVGSRPTPTCQQRRPISHAAVGCNPTSAACGVRHIRNRAQSLSCASSGRQFLNSCTAMINRERHSSNAQSHRRLRRVVRRSLADQQECEKDGGKGLDHPDKGEHQCHRKSYQQQPSADACRIRGSCAGRADCRPIAAGTKRDAEPSAAEPYRRGTHADIPT